MKEITKPFPDPYLNTILSLYVAYLVRTDNNGGVGRWQRARPTVVRLQVQIRTFR